MTPGRATKVTEPPDGFRYVRAFLSASDERELLREVETYAFHEVQMRGQVARRTLIQFGWDYDIDGWKLERAASPPPRLRELADRAAELAGIPAESLEQFLVTRYRPGAAIGWHRDAPMFGSPVIGISLASHCAMKFRRETASGFEVFTHLLEPRSLYILDGAARSQWQHSIPPTKALRYSISMRTVRRKAVE